MFNIFLSGRSRKNASLGVGRSVIESQFCGVFGNKQLISDGNIVRAYVHEGTSTECCILGGKWKQGRGIRTELQLLVRVSDSVRKNSSPQFTKLYSILSGLLKVFESKILARRFCGMESIGWHFSTHEIDHHFLQLGTREQPLHQIKRSTIRSSASIYVLRS